MLLPLDKRNIYFDLIGADADPVVCFGHSLASDSGMWTEQIPLLLASGYRVLRVDMIGHGGSDSLPGIYTMDQIADDTAEVIKALEIKNVHYIGLSIGGMYGQPLGVRHADKVKSLMLCDTRAAAPAGDKERRAPTIAKVRNANSLAPIAEDAMNRWFTKSFQQSNLQRCKQIYDIIIGTSADGYIGCATAIQNFNYVEQDPAIKAPTLVMRGSDDHGATPEESQRLLKLIPNSKYDEIAGARHICNVECPDAFNKMMMDWLKSNP